MAIRCIKCNEGIKNLGKYGKLWCNDCKIYVCYNCKKGDDKCPFCKSKMKYEAHMLLVKLLTFALSLTIILVPLIFYNLPDIQGHPLGGRDVDDDITIEGNLICQNETAIWGVDQGTGIQWFFNDTLSLDTDRGNVDIELTFNSKISPDRYENIDDLNSSKMYYFNSGDYVEISGTIQIDDSDEKYVEVTELEKSSPGLSMFKIALFAIGLVGLAGIITITIFYRLGKKNERSHMEKYNTALSEGKTSLEKERIVWGYPWTNNPRGLRIRKMSILFFTVFIMALFTSLYFSIFYKIWVDILVIYFIIFLGLLYSISYYVGSSHIPWRLSISDKGLFVQYKRQPMANSVRELKWDDVLKMVISNRTGIKFVLKNKEERILFSTDVIIIEQIISQYLTFKRKLNSYRTEWNYDALGETRSIRWQKISMSTHFNIGGIIFFAGSIILGVMSIVIIEMKDTFLLSLGVFTLLLAIGMMIIGVLQLFFRSVITGIKRIGFDDNYLHLRMEGEKRRMIFPFRIPIKSIIAIQFRKEGTLIYTSLGLTYCIPSISRTTTEHLMEELNNLKGQSL